MTDIANIDEILILLLIVFAIAAFILWFRGRKIKEELAEIKQGKYKTTRWHKLLVALGIRKKIKPPHGAFKQGDVNIRVYRSCERKKK